MTAELIEDACSPCRAAASGPGPTCRRFRTTTAPLRDRRRRAGRAEAEGLSVARQPAGPPPPPVVQRVRMRYAKRGRLRFTSHHDFTRALERALRRAGVPMAYSAGFTPHPKISYIGAAAPTGVASDAEYLELGLASVVDVDRLRAALDASLPDGLDVLECVEVRPGTGSLADRIDGSAWRVELPGVALAELETALGAFLAAERVEVERLTKSGRRRWTPARPWSARARRCAPARTAVRYLNWSYGRLRRRYDPTTCSPRCVPSPAWRQPSRHRRSGWRRVGLTTVAGSPTRSRRIARRTSRATGAEGGPRPEEQDLQPLSAGAGDRRQRPRAPRVPRRPPAPRLPGDRPRARRHPRRRLTGRQRPRGEMGLRH